MENININLTENEIQTLLDEALTGELHEVFEWNFTSDKGNKINRFGLGIHEYDFMSIIPNSVINQGI